MVSWHHSAGENPIDLPIIIGELARTAGRDETITLFIPGWGEEQDSAEEVVRVWEEQFGRPAVAAWISYCLLPPTDANLLKIAVDVPQELANFIGEGRPVNVMMHSLGNLAVLAAARAPGLFAAVCSDSPQPLASNHWGRLPLVGSLQFARPVVAAKRLLETHRQLPDLRNDERYKRLKGRGRSDILKLGANAWSAASLAFSDGVSGEAAQAYVTLDKEGHPVLIIAGQEDRVVPPREVGATLRRTEKNAGLPEGHFEMVELPGIPHTPWFYDVAVKLAPFDRLLRQQQQSRRSPKQRRRAA